VAKDAEEALAMCTARSKTPQKGAEAAPVAVEETAPVTVEEVVPVIEETARVAEEATPVATEKSATASDTERQAISWVQGCTGLTCSGSFAAWLKDGTVLCNLVNAIHPGSVRKINQSKMPFKQMENIKSFLEASRALGVRPHDCFETLDLFEEKDLMLVAQTLHALGSAVQKSCPNFAGPKLGVKKADKNVRTFTAAQLARGSTYGSLATQGSAGIMERTAMTTSNDINFGTKSSLNTSPQKGARRASLRTAVLEFESKQKEGPLPSPFPSFFFRPSTHLFLVSFPSVCPSLTLLLSSF
jgi:hypothetical protein